MDASHILIQGAVRVTCHVRCHDVSEVAACRSYYLTILIAETEDKPFGGRKAEEQPKEQPER